MVFIWASDPLQFEIRCHRFPAGTFHCVALEPLVSPSVVPWLVVPRTKLPLAFLPGVRAVTQPDAFSLAASAQSKTLKDLDILPGCLYVPGAETSLALEVCGGFLEAGSKLSTPRSD